MEVNELLKNIEQSFSQHGVESPRLIAEMLTAAAFGTKRLELTLIGSDQVPESCRTALLASQARINTGEPIQYVLGETDFMGHSFTVDPRALIPRPETEQLVETILNKQELWQRSAPICAADVGTGSGCIAISLALAHPECHWLAIDRSPMALELAMLNAQRHHLRSHISWQTGDLLEQIPANTLDLIVSNLPYIPSSVCDTLSPTVRNFEPRTALDGGVDGMTLISRLIVQAREILKPEGWIYLEIGYDQGHTVRTLLEENGFQSVTVARDLAGHDRIASGKMA